MKAFHLRSTLSKCTRCVYSRETASNRPYVPLIQKKMSIFFLLFFLKSKNKSGITPVYETMEQSGGSSKEKEKRHKSRVAL